MKRIQLPKKITPTQRIKNRYEINLLKEGKSIASITITNKPKEAVKIENNLGNNEIEKRNKNLLKGIFSHLGKAKEILDKDSKIIKQQESVTQKITQHIKHESSDFREQHKLQLETKKIESTNKRKTIEHQIVEKEKEIFTVQICEYYDLLSNYILTKCSPQIYWLPVQDTESTKKLLEESKTLSKTKKENYKKNFDSKEFDFEMVNNNIKIPLDEQTRP